MTSAHVRSGPASPPQADPAADEAELISRVAEGDRGEPMEELCHTYSRRIYSLGLQMLGDRGQAEEMVQDTFVRLWKSASKYDASIASPKTFIFTMARRAAIDIGRKNATRPPQSRIEAADFIPESPGDEKFDQVLLRIDVREAIETLSEKHRETIDLCYTADMTQTQIAETLGIPLGTVKTRIHHAIKALKVEMEGRELLA